MKPTKAGWILALSAAALALILSGCLDKAKIKALYGHAESTATEQATEQADKTYRMQGSVTAIPLMQAISDALCADHPFEFAAVGREEALAAVESGSAEAAIFDGLPDDVSDSSNATIIAQEGIVVLVNPDFPADEISVDQLVAIFTDQDNVLADQTVNVIVTKPEALSRQVFEDIFPIRGDIDGTSESLIPSVATIAQDDAEVVALVAKDPTAIGIVCSKSPTGSAKVLRIDGIAPDEPGYAGSRSLILLCADPANETSQAIKAYLTGEQGVAVLSGNGYVPVK